MHNDDESFLSKAEVRAMVKLSYAETARREKDGRFPQRIPLGDYPNSRRVYRRSEIQAWIRQQIVRARGADAS